MGKRIYLDYAATTPVDPRVLRAMQPYFAKEFGNPGSLHSFGQKAIAAIDAARETIAIALGLPQGDGFRSILFTGSATEANNLALRGTLKAASTSYELRARATSTKTPLAARRSRFQPRIIVSAIEHESVLETARDLEREGVEVIYLPVDRHGVVSLSALRSALTPHTVLVSVMYGNNEIGTIQPIEKIAKIIRDFRRATSASYEREGKASRSLLAAYPLLHTDAAQCFAYLPCHPEELGVDLMTLSAHKIGGPKGVGALFMRDCRWQVAGGSKESPLQTAACLLQPILTGGGQEFGLRSGTENVPLIAGFAKAVELAVKERTRNTRHVERLKQMFSKEVKRIVPEAKVRVEKDSLPHILSIHFPGVLAADLLTTLDRRGIALSSGSACRSRSFEPSYVLTAIAGEKAARETIRASFGKPTSASEVRATLKALKSFFTERTKSAL